MTLQETAQILGGIGVIASIVYVGIQIRNNARPYAGLKSLVRMGSMGEVFQ